MFGSRTSRANVLSQDFGHLGDISKDIINVEYLQTLGLNERPVKAVLYANENKKITNGEYQKINDCSRNTASNDLTDLVLLQPSGQRGAGAFYTLK